MKQNRTHAGHDQRTPATPKRVLAVRSHLRAMFGSSPTGTGDVVVLPSSTTTPTNPPPSDHITL
jgi:hypothetical protein